MEVYLDHINGAPLDPEVIRKMQAYLATRFANPLGLYPAGEASRQALETAREHVARLVGAEPREIIFTSCGTEANNTALLGLAAAYRRRGNHIITSAIEHASVVMACQRLERQGFDVTYLPVDRSGRVNPDDVKKAITDRTTLVSIQMANNEIGTVQPAAEIGRITRERGVRFHSDAVSAAGRVPIDVQALGVDAMSLAASQIYGPQGAGALYLRRGVRLEPFLVGGVQEEGRRAGTQSVLACVGFGEAARIARLGLNEWGERLSALQRGLMTGLESSLDRMIFTGHLTHRLPGHVSLCLEFIEGEALVRALGREGIACATASACRDYAARKISHVLGAIGLDVRLAQGSLVLSLGKDNTMAEVEYTTKVVTSLVGRLRAMSPVYQQVVRSSEGTF